MVEYIVNGKLVHAKFHIGDSVQIKPSMRNTPWCYPGQWIVHDACSDNNIMIFKHYTGEFRIFNDKYFEPYASDSVFVETLLTFRKYCRQDNWRMFLYFIKLCFLYTKRVVNVGLDGYHTMEQEI